MTFGPHMILLVVAVGIFAVEAWRTKSLVALGLAVFALAFLVT